jgi:hypothetical protein
MGIVMEDSVGWTTESGMMVSAKISEGGAKAVQRCDRMLGVLECFSNTECFGELIECER